MKLLPKKAKMKAEKKNIKNNANFRNGFRGGLLCVNIFTCIQILRNLALLNLYQKLTDKTNASG